MYSPNINHYTLHFGTVNNYLRCREMANNSSQSNEVCFLTNAEFDYMVQTKHEAEEAIGWKILPEDTVYRVERMTPIQTKWGS